MKAKATKPNAATAQGEAAVDDGFSTAATLSIATLGTLAATL